jgi:hypothetical protein
MWNRTQSFLPLYRQPCFICFKEPVTLYELLLDNDPRFEIKKKTIPAYNEAYDRYCNRDWKGAKEIFLEIYREYALAQVP